MFRFLGYILNFYTNIYLARRKEPIDFDDDFDTELKEYIVLLAQSMNIDAKCINFDTMDFECFKDEVPFQVKVTKEPSIELERSFKKPMLGNAHLLLEQELKWARDTYFAKQDDATGPHSPYIAITQSSGTGKTKMIREIAASCKRVVLFLCLRDLDEVSNYPYKTKWVSEFISRISLPNQAEKYYIGEFIAYILSLFVAMVP